MTELKCPVCNKPMKQATYDYDKKDNDDTLYMSIMPCDCVCNFAASKAVWELLADTKKKLDIAVDALNTIKGKHDPRCAVYHIDEKTAYDALEQINEIKGGK